ncbi:MAG: hypothetical protein R3A44_10370 [Caldilineaceae bacterium]
MSIWQEFPTVDVLSIGSQGQKFSDKLNEYISKWEHVIVWLDELDLTKRAARCLGARGLSSPKGKDANDLLQAGILRDYLSAALRRKFSILLADDIWAAIYELESMTIDTTKPEPEPDKRPQLPADLWVDFATYAEAWKAGRSLLIDYQIATWLDRDTNRYRVTAPGASKRELVQSD